MSSRVTAVARRHPAFVRRSVLGLLFVTSTETLRGVAVPVRARVWQSIARLPFTAALLGATLVAGVLTGGLWSPLHRTAVWPWLAPGLPAFAEGHWWTIVTGAFVIAAPGGLALALAALVPIGLLEWSCGWRRTAFYFSVAQACGVLASAATLWLLTFTPWQWGHLHAAALVGGFSAGSLGCLAAMIGRLSSPWRTRAWLVLLSALFLLLLFWGTAGDIARTAAVLSVLCIDRSLHIQRSTLREQRLIAFVALVSLGATEIVVLLAPTSGPFGPTETQSGSLPDILSDIAIILFVSHGLRLGRRWAWLATVALAIFNLAGAALLLILIGNLGWGPVQELIEGSPSLSLATAALWLALLVYMVFVRGAFHAHRRRRLGRHPYPRVDEVKDAIRSFGGGAISWMASWDDNSYARTTTGLVAYQRRAGVAIALGDPLGAAEGRAQSVRDFIADAEDLGLIPCFFSATATTREALPDGWRSLVIADDTIVDLTDLEFRGKSWNSVRTTLNKAAREEIGFRLTHLTQESKGIQAQVRAISEIWAGDRGLPEMGFTLGTLVEAEDPEVRLAVALSREGDVVGFLSWLPVYGEGGVIRSWTLDLMRRREGGFGPVIEFLIASSAMTFRDEGIAEISLSGAPLARDYTPDDGRIADLGARLSRALEPTYGFRSLRRFKEKFHPRYDTMFLLYRDESDLGRIAAGLTRAFLPQATWRQFAGAGVGLLRADRAPAETRSG